MPNYSLLCDDIIQGIISVLYLIGLQHDRDDSRFNQVGKLWKYF